MESLSNREQSAFIRFAWGRSRLPPAKDFTTQMRLTPNSDSRLPIAHTCFFSIELPSYSSKEVLQRRLLYAIHNCQEVDGDETGIGMRAGDMTWE